VSDLPPYDLDAGEEAWAIVPGFKHVDGPWYRWCEQSSD
jgi:hypothetical protein